MTTSIQSAWTEANQAFLMAEIGRVRARLDAFRAGAEAPEVEAPLVVVECFADGTAPPAIDRLCRIFQLSDFERLVLLACAGAELDAACAATLAAFHPQAVPAPTVAMLLAAFAEAHWDALSPAAPLRHWRLVETAPATTLSSATLRLDERILHFLTGTSYLDRRLDGLLEPVALGDKLPASQAAIAARGAELWRQCSPAGKMPVIELNGADAFTRAALAAEIARGFGPLLRIALAALPLQHAELHALALLVDRECLMAGGAILLDISADEAQEPARRAAMLQWVTALRAPLIVSAAQRMSSGVRQAILLDVAKPLPEEQCKAWKSYLGRAAAPLNGHVQALVEQFNLSEEQIRLCAAQAEGRRGEGLFTALWNACRTQVRPQLEGLAERVETGAGWEALVLPAAQMETLRSIVLQMRHRSRVYRNWHFATGGGARGLGITALFSGASGTGKTTAAEVLAHELMLDLYRIDLSQVVSKYIGETEKSLRRIFDAAEDGGALLFFDEADALFGKRTEVRDSHDRYANIEVSYLLQRMEQYRGMAVLATNMKQSLDPAFLRRLRFVVHFPFPDAALREQIWQRMLPPEAPVEALDLKQLARLNVAGGNIRNIALGAAFLAADAGTPISMQHLLRAAETEYMKIEKPLTEAEIRGWAS